MIKRFKIYDLGLKILLAFSLIFLNHQSLIINPVQAAESSSSANMATKIKELLNNPEVASGVARLKQEVNKRLQNKAYIGIIKSKSDNSLTIATRTGTKIIAVNEYTEYSGKSKAGIKNLLVDDTVAALGDIDDNEVLTAKKIVKTASSSAERKALFGEIINIGSQTVTIRDKNNKSLVITVDKETTYMLRKTPGSLTDLKATKPVAVIGEETRNKNIRARFIYILPYSSVIKPKIATSAASASPSANPSIKKK